MSKTVEIEALKPFNKTPQGDLCEAGDRFPVGEIRADELARLGLAKRTKASATVKVAPEPANKMAPEPANKGPTVVTSSVTGRRTKLSGRD